MEVKVEIRPSDLRALEKKLQELPNKLRMNTLRTAIFRGAQAFVPLMKAQLLANGNYQSGQLYNSIGARRRRPLGYYVRAKSGSIGAPHAHLIEFGHRTVSGGFVPPYSFIRKIIFENEPTSTEAIRSFLSSKIKEFEGDGILRPTAETIPGVEDP